MGERPRFAIVASPGFIAAVLLLVANDHVLKAGFPGIVTGKLSDVAGLFVVGALAVRFVPSRSTRALGGVGALFIFWKSPLSQPLIDAWNGVGPFTIVRVVDWTDLLALPVLPLALLYSRSAFSVVPVRITQAAMLAVTALAIMATSKYPGGPPTWIFGDRPDKVARFDQHAKFTTPLNFIQTVQHLGQAGLTVRWSLLPRWHGPHVHSSVQCGINDSPTRALVTAETRMSGVLENTIELKSLTVCRRFAPASSAEASAIFEREVLTHLPDVRRVDGGREH